MLAYFPLKLPWPFKLMSGTFLLIQTDLSTEFSAADSLMLALQQIPVACVRVFFNTSFPITVKETIVFKSILNLPCKSGNTLKSGFPEFLL